MDLPGNLIVLSSLKVGTVYKLTAPELITTEIPHYFVIVAINNEENFMLLSTTQYQNKINYLQKRNIDLDTLVSLSPNEDNGLTQNSYFDCNHYYTITKEKLVEKANKGELNITGNINQYEYDVLKGGISLSITNDIPEFLLTFT